MSFEMGLGHPSSHICIKKEKKGKVKVEGANASRLNLPDLELVELLPRRRRTNTPFAQLNVIQSP